jgi:dienelactone hydrolase
VFSFHGGLGRDASRPTEPITVFCHGANDPYVSKEEITAFQQEMRDTNADWQMIYYANAVHGFTIQNMEMTIQSFRKAALFEHLKLFLNEVLKNNLVTPVIQNRYYE